MFILILLIWKFVWKQVSEAYFGSEDRTTYGLLFINYRKMMRKLTNDNF